ncbi:MAG: hypothetical protein KIT73_01315, partial [Burkholderiales bacterium]|nr:hypothetical protein [Burkholderiales bacterium]
MSLSVGDGQHSERSLQVLIERRREMESIEDVRARTPWDWGSPVRAAAMLGTGILDPINLASAFFPAAEALQAMRLTGAANALRAVETLGSGSPSLLTRAGARAVTGAAEGVAGTVALEPLYAFARRDMGDDYGMVDSITNIAFGGLFGGGLHMGIGAAGDAVRALRGQTRAAPGPAPEPTMLDKMRIATETQSREMIGESMRRESPAHIEEMLAEAGTAPPKRASTPEEVMRAADEIRREMASRAPMTEERAALRELEAERGGLDAMLDTRDPEVRAENEQRISLLDEEIAQRRADLETREVVEAAARGETTAQFDAMVQERVAANRSREALLDAIDAAPEGSARWRAQQASPETREAAGRTAVAQMVDGRSPDVDAIMGLETGASTMDDVRAAADRQRSADSLRTADVKGSEDAAVMAQEAKKPQNLQEAEAELQRALDELAEIEKAGADAFRYARAYHGTPHRFDKFSTAKIGSGEGAQSYGWGLYFASRKEVAEHYRDGLAEATATVDGKPIEPLNPLHIAARQLAESKGDRAAAIKALDDVAAVAKRYLDDDFETIDEAASLLDSDASIPDYAPGVGQLYEVEVPDDGELLLWDRPLGEQPDGVRKALRN